MAQIIKHRRGNAEELGSTTLYKGEMGVTTGSNVAGGLANPIVHIGDGANAGGFVVGRLQYGTSTPNISSGYNATLNDILFYNQHNNKLERLHQSGNETLDLFGNLTSGTMSGSVEITGMISASGGITASDIWASGDIHAVGNITFEAGAGGTITLGDSAADNVVFGADVQSSIIPDSNDTYDLGSTGQRWNNLWVSGSITANGGPHSILSATTIDLDAEGALTLDGGSISIGNDADVVVDIESSTFDVDASGVVGIDSDGVMTLGAASFDIDADGGAIAIDGTSTISIDGADDMNFTITSGTAGEDLTISQVGGNDSSIFITAAGTGTDAISIDATAGDMLIAPNLINGKTLKIGPSSATQMVFTPHGTAASEKISLINTAGTADDAIKIDSVAGGLLLAAGNDSLHIDADGTDADALNIDSAGGIDVDASAGLTITSTTMALDPSSTFDLDAAGAITIDGSSITLGGDADTAFDIDTSTLDIDASGNVTIDAGSSSGISLDASAASNFTTSAGALTLAGVSLDVDATAGAFNIAATAASTITTSGGALTLDGETGVNIQENGATIISVDTSRNIVVGNATSTETVRIGHSTSEVTVGDNLTVIGNLNVTGTETIVDSNVVNISDNIIQVNTGGAKRKGGLQVIDTDGDQTGSVVWDSDGNYFEVGLSGSEYRLPELSTATELSANNNRVLISDGARIDASAAITDDGTTVDISNRVDAQASLQVSGSIYVSAGASVAASLASLVSFRNNGSTQLGYLASANTSAVTTGLVGYNASTGNLTISSVIDGGSF